MHLRFPVALLALSLGLAVNQSPAQSSGSNDPATILSAAPDITPSLNALADQPATHFGITFDRSMLQSARNLLESEGLSPERAAAALTSITYDNYRYSEPATYSPETFKTILDAFHLAGWNHLVNAHPIPAHSEAAHPMATDLWLHTTGANIDGIIVLTRGTKNVNLVRVACDLRPLDLLHLSGHFGLPKIDPSAVMIPDPKEN
jgi:hypothetical protein